MLMHPDTLPGSLHPFNESLFHFPEKKKTNPKNLERSVNCDDIASFQPALLRFDAGAASPLPAAGPAGVWRGNECVTTASEIPS